MSATGRPKIGVKFYASGWVFDNGGRIKLTADDALRATASEDDRAMRRVERDRGVRLGDFQRTAWFDKDRAEWRTMTEATVVGYA